MSNADPSSFDFAPDEALILRDLARNGSVDETNFYDYSNAASHGQQNGDAFDDMDSAALLESLANYQPEPNHDTNGQFNSNESNSFERLLEAAATAESQEAHGNGVGGHQSPEINTSALFPSSSPDLPKDDRTFSKRKRSEEPSQSAAKPKPSKRQKAFEAEYEAREQEIWGTEEYDEDYIDAAIAENERMRESANLKPRDVGVHQAAALFRRPTAASKKYTRPPMARLFTSLQITAEEFLHLQAAAKDFMLDPSHPDRYETVGNKDRGDSDMIKLKLFACVKSFLEGHWGDRLWGSGATNPQQQTLRWPSAEKRITTLITPLLRRMVTNEKQRLYAIDQRDSRRNAKKKEKEKRRQMDEIGRKLPSLSSHPDVDPKLDEYLLNVAPHLPAELTEDPPDTQIGPEHISETEESPVHYHVNLVENGNRFKPKLTLTPTSCPGFSSLIQHVQSLLEGEKKKMKGIKVLGPYGQVTIGDEDAWREVTTIVMEEEWMDGDVKIIVQVENES